MNIQKHIESMKRFPKILCSLIAELDDSQIRWKPESGNWSILEIVCHLADEEVEDFRVRVQLGIESPDEDWPAWDPEGVAVSRKYNEQELEPTLNRFLSERKKSLDWLKSLSPDANWAAFKQRPSRKVHVGDIMSGWVAHDLLHVRQITKRLFEMTMEDSKPFDTGYGGDW